MLLHFFRCGNTQKGKTSFEDIRHCFDESKAGVFHALVLVDDSVREIKTIEYLRQIYKIVAYQTRLVSLRRGFHRADEFFNVPYYFPRLVVVYSVRVGGYARLFYFLFYGAASGISILQIGRGLPVEIEYAVETESYVLNSCVAQRGKT